MKRLAAPADQPPTTALHSDREIGVLAISAPEPLVEPAGALARHRFPPPRPLAPPPAALRPCLPAADGLPARAGARVSSPTPLVVLHYWTFTPSKGGDFEQVVKAIRVRPNGGVLRFANLPRGRAGEERSARASRMGQASRSRSSATPPR